MNTNTRKQKQGKGAANTPVSWSVINRHTLLRPSQKTGQCCHRLAIHGVYQTFLGSSFMNIPCSHKDLSVSLKPRPFHQQRSGKRIVFQILEIRSACASIQEAQRWQRWDGSPCAYN